MMFASLLTFLVACQNDSKSPKFLEKSADFTVTTNEPTLQYENLRLLPIVATNEFIVKNAGAAALLTLQEALDHNRFRITEKKPFGRREDEQAVNALLVQNKTENAVFLLAGEVVQGGQQDRVIAEDAVVAARSLNHLPVFCVEPGRWNYHESADSNTISNDKKVYAFTGYYHVASPPVRRSAQYERDQAAVWKHVADITEANHATTETGTYAGLENSKTFTQTRNRYLDFFKNKLSDSENIIGIVAISGGEVIGVDVFAHPTLFQKQYESLLHSYATHALTAGKPVEMSAKGIELYAENLPKKYVKSARAQWNGMVLHWGEL
jgi:hypothetical protein